MVPVRTPAVTWHGAGELDAVYLRVGPGGGRARPRHGTCPGYVQPLPRPAPADRVLRAAARPRASAAHRLGEGRILGPERVGDDGQGHGNRRRPIGRGPQTTQMTSSAVCALTTLAFRLDAAVLAAAANVAGSGEWPSSLATRTVTSYLLGGLSMPGTVIVVREFPGADLVSRPRAAGRRKGVVRSAPRRGPLLGGLPRLTDGRPGRRGGHRASHISMLGGGRPDPGRDPDRRAAAGGSTTAPGGRGWHRASG